MGSCVGTVEVGLTCREDPFRGPKAPKEVGVTADGASDDGVGVPDKTALCAFVVNVHGTPPLSNLVVPIRI